MIRSHLSSLLASHEPTLVDPSRSERHAAVTMIVRPTARDIDVLFVRRAEVPGDPWSGHMALPGGHRDPTDPDLLETAIRETNEEVGLALPRDAFLGRLDDLHPVSRRIPSILISPFVAWLDGDPAVIPNEEVQYPVWAPLTSLRDPANRGQMTYPDSGGARVLPTIEIEGDTIWGLTHRIVMDFLDLVS